MYATAADQVKNDSWTLYHWAFCLSVHTREGRKQEARAALAHCRDYMRRIQQNIEDSAQIVEGMTDDKADERHG